MIPIYIPNETVLAAQAGDQKALTALCEHMSGRIGTIPKYNGRSHYAPVGGHAGALADKSNDTHEDAMDIAQEGYLAVLEALPRWKPELGKFETFVYARMRGTMSEAKEQHSSAPSIPTASRKRYFRIMAAANGDPRDAEDMAQGYGMSRANFADVHRAMTMTTSVHAHGDEDDGGDDDYSGVYEVEDHRDDYQLVVDREFGQAMLKYLAPSADASPRERHAAHTRIQVVDMAFGITTREPMIQEDIAAVLKVSQSTVNEHLAKAIKILQEVRNG